MAGTGTHDVGASHPRAPVRPPRRVLPPDPATAPDDGGWTTLGTPLTPAQRHRRLDRALWGLVAAVVVAGLAIIGALIASGPSSDVRLPPGTAATDALLSQRTDAPAESDPAAPLTDGPAPRAGPPDHSHDIPADSGDVAAGGPADGHSGTTGSLADDAEPGPPDQSDVPDGGAAGTGLNGGPPHGGAPDGHPNDDAATGATQGQGSVLDQPGHDGAGSGGPAGNAAGDDGTNDTSPSPDGPGSAPAGWSEVARGFGLAFTRTAVGRDVWFATMSSWLTPEQAAQYRDVPIDAIPTGQLTKIDVADPGSASYAHGTLTYDTGMVLTIGLSYLPTAGGWLVARVELASATETG